MEKKYISPEDLEKVTGGYVVYDPGEDKYWLVRQDGTVIAPVPARDKAVEFAKAFSTRPDVITMEEYRDKYGRDLVW